MTLLHASILTIFPEMFPGPLQYSLIGQALKKRIWQYELINIKNFGLTKHFNVDDKPYGGGNGLVMRADVLGKCLDYILDKKKTTIYYPSPRGIVFNQNLAHEILLKQDIIILCGRFEGIDERVIEEYNIQEISIGDYIISGGEIAAFVMLDCIIRLIPGVLSNQKTLLSESFEKNGEFLGLLEGPLYTRPVKWKGREVPKILLSGNKKAISCWNKEQSIEITKKRRPDLLT